MASIRNVLNKYVDAPEAPNAQLGYDETQHEEGPKTKRVLEKERLRIDLASVRRSNTIYFLICVAMVAVLFLVSIAVVFTNLNDPKLVKIAMGAFGVSTAGLITVMTNLWRAKSNAEVILLLIPGMDADALKTVILILAKRL